MTQQVDTSQGSPEIRTHELNRDNESVSVESAVHHLDSKSDTVKERLPGEGVFGTVDAGKLTNPDTATTECVTVVNENKNESSPSNYNPERNDGSDPNEVIDTEKKKETTWQRARREWLALTEDERRNYFPWMRTEYTAGTATPQQAMDALEEILAENAWSDDEDDDDKKPESGSGIAN